MRCLLSILFIGLIVPTAVAEPKKYVDATDHYSIEIPDGWEETPKGFIDASNGLLKQNPQAKNIRYVTGFKPKNLAVFGSVYCLTQRNLNPYSPPSSLDAAFKQITGKAFEKSLDQAVEKMSLLISKAKLEKPYMDRERKMILVPLEMTAVFGGKIKVLAVVYVGKKRIAQLNFCAHESEWEKHYPEFKQMMDSFQFEPGYEFRESIFGFSGRPFFDWTPAGTFALVCVAIGGAVWIIRRAFRRRAEQNDSLA